jgi:hypothetical protein
MAEQRKGERRKAERRVAHPKLITTRQDILKAAKDLHWKGQLPNWTTVVEGRELPARPVVLRAARVSDNNPTNSTEAAVILSDLGFEVRFKGTTVPYDDMPD